MNNRDNILLDEIEESEDFSTFTDTISTTLEDQWMDISTSGVIDEIYDESGLSGSKQSKNPSIRRAVSLWVIAGAALNKVKIERWVYNKIINKIKPVTRYTDYQKEARKFFTHVFNRGWQNEIDLLLWKWKMDFNLTNAYYKEKIRERINNLYSDWSKTTAKKFTAEVMKWIKSKEKKNQMISRILKDSEDIIEQRTDMIGITETNAILEYSRLETARMNWVEWKTWHTAEDQNVCKICDDMNGESIAIDETFSCWVQYPWIHVSCRCYCDYTYDNYWDDVEKKKRDVYVFYQNEKDRIYPIWLNKEYIWVWWKTYHGLDRDMDSFIGMFNKKDVKELWTDLDEYTNFIRDIPRDILPYEMYFNVGFFRKIIWNDSNIPMDARISIIWKSDRELAVIMAKSILTNRGFEQLLKKV